MDYKNIETKEKINFWKYVLTSVIWSLLAISICGYFFEFGLKMMSKANTLSFLCGFVIVAVSVILLFVVIDYHHFKIKKIYKVKKSQDKQSKSDKENEPNSGNS